MVNLSLLAARSRKNHQSSGGNDPYFASVVSLLHFNGTNGSQVFVDQKGKSWTANSGNTIISTAQSRFGASSVLIGTTTGAGTSNGLYTPTSTDFSFGTADFTVEWWQYVTSLTDYQNGFSRGGLAAGDILFQTGPGNGKYIAYMSGSVALTEASASTIGVWEFHALVKDSGVLRKYRGGVQTAFATNSASISNSLAFEIGAHQGTYAFCGYMDEFRVTKGVCRYPNGASFSVPTAAFPDN